MRLAAAAAAITLMALPAPAETVVSTSSGPATGMLAALMGAEKSAIARLPEGALLPKAPEKPLKKTAQKRDRKGKTPSPPSYDADWLASLPAAPEQASADWQCLTRAIYFEARGETIAGQAAVGEVILNRVDSPLYPDTVCAVVGQSGGGGCQFSYVCDGRADTMSDPAARAVAGRIANALLSGTPRLLTQGATHFHTPAVRPAWSRQFPRTAAIGYHIFYRQPGAGTAAQIASN